MLELYEIRDSRSVSVRAHENFKNKKYLFMKYYDANCKCISTSCILQTTLSTNTTDTISFREMGNSNNNNGHPFKLQTVIVDTVSEFVTAVQ